jgi:hypothetical protein
MKSRLKQEGVGLSGTTNFGAWVTEHHEAIAILYFRFFTDTMQRAVDEEDDEAIDNVMPLDNFVFGLWKEREGGKDLVDAYEKHRPEQQGMVSSQTQRFSDN